jgi:hypothetical protein
MLLALRASALTVLPPQISSDNSTIAVGWQDANPSSPLKLWGVSELADTNWQLVSVISSPAANSGGQPFVMPYADVVRTNSTFDGWQCTSAPSHSNWLGLWRVWYSASGLVFYTNCSTGDYSLLQHLAGHGFYSIGSFTSSGSSPVFTGASHPVFVPHYQTSVTTLTNGLYSLFTFEQIVIFPTGWGVDMSGNQVWNDGSTNDVISHQCYFKLSQDVPNAAVKFGGSKPFILFVCGVWSVSLLFRL